MRTELRKRGVKKLKVVYSKEKPISPKNIKEFMQETVPNTTQRTGNVKKQIPGSTAFVPSVVGLIIAGEVIKDLSLKN